MERTSPGADFKPVRGRNGGADISFCHADRVAKRLAFSEACGDRRSERAAAAMGVSGRNTGRRQPLNPFRLNQQIDAFRASDGKAPVNVQRRRVFFHSVE